MKAAVALACALLFSAAATACERPASTTEGRGITETTSGNIDVADARSPEGFVRAKKAYMAAMEAKIVEADRRLDALKSSADRIDDSARRAQIKAAIGNARAQREVFRLDVRSLGYEPQQTWDEDRAAMDRKWDALRGTIDRIEQQIAQPPP